MTKHTTAHARSSPPAQLALELQPRRRRRARARARARKGPTQFEQLAGATLARHGIRALGDNWADVVHELATALEEKIERGIQAIHDIEDVIGRAPAIGEVVALEDRMTRPRAD